MIDATHIVTDPLLPNAIIAGLGSAAVGLTAYGFYKQQKGSFGRALAATGLVLCLLNPALITEKREALPDIALMVIDESGSMRLGHRQQQSQQGAEAMAEKLAQIPGLEVETLRVDGANETDLFHAIEHKLSSLPTNQVAGVIAITDGLTHDTATHPLPVPLHVLLAGDKNEHDRRLDIKSAPAYSLVGQTSPITLRVEDRSARKGEQARVTFYRDDGVRGSLNLPIGEDVTWDAPIRHAGHNLFAFSVDSVDDEITTLNNHVSADINGIRDRLSVLLISGQPHVGERTWRNFLKSDAAVDLVHFTIMRSPAQQDRVPEREMALIPFPMHELFDEKLNSFDLVILDRLKNQSLIPTNYLENIAQYVRKGGALLVSTATDSNFPPFLTTPLAPVLPAAETGPLLTGEFRPTLTDIGKRHPVTRFLDSEKGGWGPWFRQLGAPHTRGDWLMTGYNSNPLIILNHEGEGRVAEILSDQFWLWSRHYENGGPVDELLRRISHWLMKEPELDETALRATSVVTDTGYALRITQQSLTGASATATLSGPDNFQQSLVLAPDANSGLLRAEAPVTAAGPYEIRVGDKKTIVLAGAGQGVEYGDVLATPDRLRPSAEASEGSIYWLYSDPTGPRVKSVGAHDSTHGWSPSGNWIGLRHNQQYRIAGSETTPLLIAPWPLLFLLGCLALLWWREGKSR